MAMKSLSDAFVGDEEAVRRFRRGVALQKRLLHANILPILDDDLEASPPFYVMPLAEGTLEEAARKGLSEKQVDDIFTAILAGVAHAHEKGVLHRDLKPANVMMTNGLIPRISDFGLGRSVTSASTNRATSTNAGAGSFLYTAPEQWRDLRSADERADIYSLGKVLHEMVTGDTPWIYPDSQIPAKYEYFIDKCTATRPEERYQSIADVRSAFEQVRAGVQRPEAPREVLDQLADDWKELPEGEDVGALRAIDELFERQRDSSAFYRDAVPRIPDAILKEYMSALPGDFRRTITKYDEYVSGGLDFAYCDVVADLYSRIYADATDLRLKRLLLSRLIDIGGSHNRFHVGQVVAALLVGIDSTAEVMMAVDVIKAQSTYAAFFWDYVKDLRLAEPIERALRGGIARPFGEAET